MAKIKNRGLDVGLKGGAPIGSRQGGAPDSLERSDPNEAGRVHRTRSEREQLSRNPDLNQAENARGSQDQTQGSQTGSDVDPIPEP